MQTTVPAERAPRMLWADMAKGACIILVVLWHVVAKFFLEIRWDAGGVVTAWSMFGTQLLPLRMPLFFTVSGLLAVRALARPWRVSFGSRVVRFARLYALWLLIHTAVFAFTPGFDTAHATSIPMFLDELFLSPTNLWYLYALPLYFVVAALTARMPAGAVIAAAVMSAAASAGLLPDGGNRWQVFQNLLFFLVGARLAPWLMRWAEPSPTRAGTPALPRILARRAATASGLYLVMLVVVSVLGAQRWFGLWPLTSAVAVLAGVALAAIAARNLPWISGGIAWIGRRTLPIYVLHLPLLALVAAGWQSVFGAEPPVPGAWQVILAAALPVLLSAALVALCLLLHRAALAARMGWLFGAAPAALARA